jgi:lipid-binding SYLF domain-containing protein
MRCPWLIPLVAGALFSFAGGAARGQSFEDETVEMAGQVLNEIMAVPVKGIPKSLLADAQAVVIIPGLLKGGFVIGVKHGKGVAVVRDDNGAWRAPVFVTATGGSIGWQIGVQATDVILVFKTRTSVAGLLRGKFTIGADAAVAAGPVGREAAAATDGQLKAEILSYSRSRGLFAGVALEGASLQTDHRGMAAYYAPRPGQPQGAIPASAVKLVQQIAAHAGPGQAPPMPAAGAPAVPPPPPMPPAERDVVRKQLADTSPRLFALVEPTWQRYLALPAEVFNDGAASSPELVKQTLTRYAAVAADPRYRALTSRREFQDTYGLLVRYATLAAPPAADPLKLPPPPP